MTDSAARGLKRRTVVQALAAGAAASTGAPLLAQPAPVRIGYAMARTGPWSVGAQTSQEPNYLLWDPAAVGQ